MTYRLRLAHLYPEQMNIYGDRGNILTLTRRCAWRGVEVELLPVGVGAAVDWQEVDIAFFGGGQDSGQALIADDFVRRQGPALRAAIEGGLVLLAICGGYQLLGHYFLTHTGERLPGIGALDVHTVGGDVRLIGNIVVEADLTTDHRAPTADHRPPITNEHNSPLVVGRSSFVRLVGFENHSGRTYLGAGVRPLGKVLAGHGNNGEDGTEGARAGNVFGTYLHGPIIPANPRFADALLAYAVPLATGAAFRPGELDDTFADEARTRQVARPVG